MRRFRTAALALAALVVPLATSALAPRDAAAATTYRVGPGHPYADPGAVPWESLAAGDSVVVHARATPYRNKWVLNRVGTEAAPIVVHGVPDPGTGALPVIDGQDATTRTQLDYWNENRGVIKIGGSNAPPDGMPAWIVVENLEIRNGHTPYTFTGRSGPTAYAGNAAAIFVEKGSHVTIRNCRLTACGNGMFAAAETSDLLVEGCRIEGNGNVGSIFEHNNYTEASGATFQFNRFGPLLPGAGGNNLKDRSAGLVVRYNWIDGGNRQLDLVESDFDRLIDDPRYRTTFVHGNVLIERDADGNSQVAHYGGDNGDASKYRKGRLHFFHNTLVSRRAGNTTLLRLSTDAESADVRDNVLFVTASGNRLAMLDSDGVMTLGRNWLKSGWVNSHSGGSPMVTNLGQLTGADPLFTNLAGEDFVPAAGSPLVDQAVALHPAAIAAGHDVVLRYVKHQAVAPRVVVGAAPDLGAFEQAGVVGVGDPPPGPPAGGLALRATPNPFSGSCVIELAGAATRADLEVVDVTGRVRARVAATAPGRWVLRAGNGLSPGTHLVRLGALSRRVTLLP